MAKNQASFFDLNRYSTNWPKFLPEVMDTLAADSCKTRQAKVENSNAQRRLYPYPAPEAAVTVTVPGPIKAAAITIQKSILANLDFIEVRYEMIINLSLVLMLIGQFSNLN